MPKLALFQPEIAANVGAVMRLCACLGVEMHVIEPCGFPWSERKIRQSAMDYYDHVDIVRHESWDDFMRVHEGGRIFLMTTKTDDSYLDVTYKEGDILLAGSESSGVPDYVRDSVYGRVTIPMRGDVRSLNLACSCAMVMGEVLRQVQ